MTTNTTPTINLDYARRAEGYIYGDGAADLAERVARAVYPYRTAADRALAAEPALMRFAIEVGHNPDMEVHSFKERGGWRVSYEAGPYQWAIVASEALYQAGVFAEPHYSFDLCFYEGD